ncbi:rac GTPase-activating protein 1 isoform X2 [Denticeps clupeoides]|nr:rac GTPase-activating protein 1-like isoform X2 [Denticeps clupeoides]
MQLMCDILVHDNKSNACLNDEQRSMLANFNPKGANVTQYKTRRLSVIDESSFLSHSDISYDRTDDDLDLDNVAIKPLKSRAREKRRSSMGPSVGPPVQKRGRGRSGDLLGGRGVEKEVEATVVKASVTAPDNVGQFHMVIDITQESSEKPPRNPRLQQAPALIDQTSVWVAQNETNMEIETITEMEVTTTEARLHQAITPSEDRTLQHVFLNKTVIRPETCVPCGKRIRFGKMALKCRDCRVVAHPECKRMCTEQCCPIAHGNPPATEDTLESFAPFTRPRVPLLIVQCVSEIEKRGLEEKGVYRVPGGERMVKELRERYISRKGSLMLNKVDDIHVVCGLLKDFFRKLKEPLVTFRLHKTFMEAGEILDDDNSAALMFQAIGELPPPNRDTLAFLMLHLQRVMQSPPCQMDKNNLSRVFGPTIVGHGMAEPCPMTIMKDTNIQPKVMARLLSFSAEYWKGILGTEGDQVISSATEVNTNEQTPAKDCMFTPLTSPELSKYSKVPSTGSLKGKIKTFGNAFNNPSKSKVEPRKNRFFTSPK